MTDDAPKPDLQPDFRDDLDSLFVLVDSRMAERRGTVASSTQEQFVGSGLEEGTTLAIRAAVREAVDDLFREKLSAEVRAAVEAALRAAPLTRQADQPRLRRSTLISIRLRKALA